MTNPVSGEVKQRIVEYVNKSYLAAYHKIQRENAIKVAQAREALAARGLAFSSVMVEEIARIQSEMVAALMEAKANALLDAYELNGAEIDGDIRVQVDQERWELIQAMVRVTSFPPEVPVGDTFHRLLISNTVGILERVECEIEQRKVIPKMRKPEPPVQNVYNLQGNNSRVNVGSTDASVNVVNITSEELFVQMRQLLSEKTEGETQARILEKLDALDKAQNTPSFGQRYSEFIAAAANHMTILTPFMPALAQMLQKVIGG